MGFLNSTPIFQKARVGSVSILVVISIGLFFGRAIEKNAQSLIGFIPWLGAAVLLLLCYAIGKTLKSSAKGGNLKNFAPALIALALSGIGASYLIVAPIEIIHLLKYGLLALCIFFSNKDPKVVKDGIISLLIAAALGSAEECAQMFIPDRVFDTRDLLLNAVGASIGSLFAISLNRALGERTRAENSNLN